MDITIVKPNNQKKLYGKLSENKFTGIEPPLWGLILAGWLIDQQFEVSMIDAEAENYSPEEAAFHIKELNPKLVLIVASGTNPSASTMSMATIPLLVEAIKKLENRPKIAIHGIHPSAMPAQTLESTGVDYVIVGEGFHQIDAMMQEYAIGNLHDRRIWKSSDDFDLSQLSRLPYYLLDLDKYRCHLCMGWTAEAGNRSPYAVLYTSLGCPYNCSFCCINTMFREKKIRYRSINDVISDLTYLRYVGVTNIKINDEMFAFKKSRVLKLCRAIVDAGLNDDDKLNMRAYARTDTVDAEMLAWMQKAGIKWIGYGFESGNQEVLNASKKGKKILSTIKNAVQMTYNAGIHIDANYMFGMTEDNAESMIETFKLMLDLNCEWANINTTMAFPGTRLFEELQPYTEYSQYTPDCNPIGGHNAVRWRDWAFNAYYRNPSYLNRIEKLFGIEAKQAMQELVKTKLRRNE